MVISEFVAELSQLIIESLNFGKSNNSIGDLRCRNMPEQSKSKDNAQTIGRSKAKQSKAVQSKAKKAQPIKTKQSKTKNNEAKESKTQQSKTK